VTRLGRRTALTLLALTVLAACEAGTDGGDGSSGQAAVDVDRGAELFATNCAVCHGEAADGTAAGPPLVHEIYEPSHHGDASFLIAVTRGVQPHHWDFGPMPPISGLDAADVADITAWVRERQREAGIE
jgi:mono/diheme cytochrome c family protein